MFIFRAPELQDPMSSDDAVRTYDISGQINEWNKFIKPDPMSSLGRVRSQNMFGIKNPISSVDRVRNYEISSQIFNELKISGKRGWVLIIQNTDFGGSKSLPDGEEVDRLAKLFENHRYNVEICKNVNADALLRQVHCYATKEESMSFVCFISSHGSYTHIDCINDTTCKTSDILKAINSRELQAKPKCLFIDACRSVGQGTGERPEIPGKDFFVGLSSLAYRPSWTADKSNIYLRCLADVFEESFPLSNHGGGKTRDILYMMTKVNRNVREYGEKFGIAQDPVFESTLTGLLFLQGDRKKEFNK
ncbi:cell death protein 3-like [Mytilus galloprovincialis]|uniref:cell death protein 3-like n=1 Tax=Mytilus galloprovincialis TaxID=29158 RepID=UPI003F7C629D